MHDAITLAEGEMVVALLQVRQAFFLFRCLYCQKEVEERLSKRDCE